MRQINEKYIRAVNRAVKHAESTDPFNICKSYGIKVHFVPLGSLKGFTATNYRMRNIFINEDLSDMDARYTCAHELGHILMRHDYNKLWMANHTFFNLNRYENEANRFAIHLLLVPKRLLLWGLKYLINRQFHTVWKVFLFLYAMRGNCS